LEFWIFLGAWLQKAEVKGPPSTVGKRKKVTPLHDTKYALTDRSFRVLALVCVWVSGCLGVWVSELGPECFVYPWCTSIAGWTTPEMPATRSRFRCDKLFSPPVAPAGPGRRLSNPEKWTTQQESSTSAGRWVIKGQLSKVCIGWSSMPTSSER